MILHVFFAIVLINFISAAILDLSCSLIAQALHLYNKADDAKVYRFSASCVFGLQMVLKFY